MYNYTASFTRLVPFKRISLTIEANDYLSALTKAREIAKDKGYRFNDLNCIGNAKKTKLI